MPDSISNQVTSMGIRKVALEMQVEDVVSSGTVTNSAMKIHHNLV